MPSVGVPAAWQNPRVDRWWARNPLRGQSVRERRRLVRLSRSGRHLDDSHDRRAVHEYIDYSELFFSSWGWKLLHRVGPWLVIPFLLAGIVVWVLRMRWLHLGEDFGLLVVYVLALVLNHSRRRAMERTARINGWA